MHLFNEETQVFLECDSSSSKWITLWRPLQWLHRSPLLTAGWIIKTDFLQFKTWSSKLTFSGNHLLPCLHPSGSSDPLNKPKGMEKSHEITHCSQRSLWNNVLNFCRGKSGERGRFSHVSSFSQPNLQRHWPSWPLLPSPAEAAKTQCIWNSTEIKCQVP